MPHPKANDQPTRFAQPASLACAGRPRAVGWIRQAGHREDEDEAWLSLMSLARQFASSQSAVGS